MASGEATGDLAAEVVERLMESYKTSAASMQHVNTYELPSMEHVARVVEMCRALIFPGFVGRSLARVTDNELRDFVRERVDELGRVLRRQLYRGLHHTKEEAKRGDDCPTCQGRAEEISRS